MQPRCTWRYDNDNKNNDDNINNSGRDLAHARVTQDLALINVINGRFTVIESIGYALDETNISFSKSS